MSPSDMVTNNSGDLYHPFHRLPVVEEGFQSSEEGSDLHSPIFEGPYPQEVRYHSGHLGFPDVATTLLPSSCSTTYSVPNVSAHVRDPHILETLQAPSPATISPLSPPPYSNISLHDNSVLEIGGPSNHLHPTLSPAAQFSFNLPESRSAEPQFRSSHDAQTLSSFRHATNVPSAAQKSSLSLSLSPGMGRLSASGSNSSAPSRPPRREASTVVIACRQCRARKIRCDSTRPVCNNCTRRSNECEYDSVPKRRGPDKKPGTRKRSCKKRPPHSEPSISSVKKKRKTGGDLEGNMISFDAKVKENVTSSPGRSTFLSRPPGDDSASMTISQSVPLVLDPCITPHRLGPEIMYPKDGYSPTLRRYSLALDFMEPGLNKSFARPIDVNIHRHHQSHEQDEKPPLHSLSLPMTYNRNTWWDLVFQGQPLDRIIDELTFLFDNSSYWLFFINDQHLFRDLQDPERRSAIHPALVLSALALATLLKSSSIELGSTGHERASYFRDLAEAALNAAYEAQDLDHTLAEAALILALFESSCHPQFTPQRAESALKVLDTIIDALKLCQLDRNDPTVSIYRQGQVPKTTMPNGYTRPKKCTCVYSPAGPNTNVPDTAAMSYTFNPLWDPNWSDAEVHQEECRRVCWGALTLYSNHSAQCMAFDEDPLNLKLSEPSNFAILFPGEAYERLPANRHVSGQSPKESVWALYCRSMLLWNSFLWEQDGSYNPDQRSRFAVDAFNETLAIEHALDMHECNLDTGIMYVCREFVHNTRKMVTDEFRRLQILDGIIPPGPSFNRREAQEWLHYQDQVAQRVRQSLMHLGETPGHLLSRRPFQVIWFACQVALCLTLWGHDHNIHQALDLAKSFLIALDCLVELWPGEIQRRRLDDLRHQLEEACSLSGVHLPLDPQMTRPPILKNFEPL